MALFPLMTGSLHAQAGLKEQLMALFKKSSGFGGGVELHAWTALNKDSGYFKHDTVIFYSNINYQHYANACDFVMWDFRDSVTFAQYTSMICYEPGVNYQRIEDQDLRVEFRYEDLELWLDIYEGRSRRESFLVLGLKQEPAWKMKQRTWVLKLQRKA